MPSWIQDPISGKLIPKSEYVRAYRSNVYIQKSFEPFTSPIDGSVISDRAQLRAHNKKHSVTDMRDYGPEWFARKKKERELELSGNTRLAREDRIKCILESINRLED